MVSLPKPAGAFITANANAVLQPFVLHNMRSSFVGMRNGAKPGRVIIHAMFTAEKSRVAHDFLYAFKEQRRNSAGGTWF